jgi:hypothetical protein
VTSGGVGQGATFTLTLPVVADRGTIDRPTPAPAIVGRNESV